jgi:hypothetical protein
MSGNNNPFGATFDPKPLDADQSGCRGTPLRTARSQTKAGAFRVSTKWRILSNVRNQRPQAQNIMVWPFVIVQF